MPVGRAVAEEVEPLQPRAVAEMEARHRIERHGRAGSGPAGSKRRRAAAAAACMRSTICRILDASPAYRATPSARARRRRAALESVGWRARGQPFGEARHRRQRHEGLHVRQLALQISSTTCLIRKLPKRNRRRGPSGCWRSSRTPRSSRPSAAIGSRSRSSSGAIAAGRSQRQRDLDEDQRLVDQLRMEEAVAAPVRRREPARRSSQLWMAWTCS